MVLGFEAGGQLAQFHVNADNLNGNLGDLAQLGPAAFSPRAPDSLTGCGD